MLKTAVLAIMIILHLGWLCGGASLAGLLRDPVRSRIANVSFALILMGATLLALIR